MKTNNGLYIIAYDDNINLNIQRIKLNNSEYFINKYDNTFYDSVLKVLIKDIYINTNISFTKTDNANLCILIRKFNI